MAKPDKHAQRHKDQLHVSAVVRPLYIAVGIVCVGIGFVGIVLPVLPTTPFLIIAVWAFSKGSPRLQRWLLQHPRFGPLLRDWRAHRVIPLRAKVFAWLMMLASFSYLLFLSDVALRYVLVAGATMLFGAVYIARTPNRVPERQNTPLNDTALNDTAPNDTAPNDIALNDTAQTHAAPQKTPTDGKGDD